MKKPKLNSDAGVWEPDKVGERESENVRKMVDNSKSPLTINHSSFIIHNSPFIINQKAFVLVTTLWVLAILTIAASFFALWTQHALNLAQTMQDDLQGEIDMSSTQATVIYLLTTQRFTIGGLILPIEDEEKAQEIEAKLKDSILAVGGEMAVDDRVYFGYGKALFALQDEAGLLGINFVSRTVMNRLIGLLGVEQEARNPLIAKFYDYIDADKLHRLNGAEAAHYEKRDLSPPSNHFLITPQESHRVLDWAEQTKLWESNQLGQLTNVVLPGLPNFNTAPAMVLQAVFNMDAESAERLIKVRQSLPFYSTKAIDQLGGIGFSLDQFDTNFFSSYYLRLTLWYQGSQRMRQIHFKLTERGDKKKPWQIEYSLELELLPKYKEAYPSYVQTAILNSTLSAKTQ